MLDVLPKMARQIRLSDGRVLAYAEHGHPSGEPVFFFHGTPGSRLFHHPDRSIATSLSARIITIDRPGFGFSDFKPGRTLLDWPEDVVELANALHIDRFAIAGISGGGPYVAACTLKIPHRLTGAAMISSLGPLVGDTTKRMAWHIRLLLGLANDSYTLAKISWWLANLVRSQNDEWLCNLEAFCLPQLERELFKNPEVRKMLVEDYAEALRHGGNGIAWDMALLARPWGFRLENIATKVCLYHGEEDVRAPAAMGRHLASSIPNSRHISFSGEGHDVFYNHWKEILATLLTYKITQADISRKTGNVKRNPLRLQRHAPAVRRRYSKASLQSDDKESAECVSNAGETG